ncbi:MAG: VPLPA-CTERM sorting domain-containing protein [Litoreibacter sp.]
MVLIRTSVLAGTFLLIPQISIAAPVVFSAIGPDAASIQDEVDRFRDALGELNPNEPENFAGGRRQINWDAAPDVISDPNAFPGDFFNGDSAPRARGIEFRPTVNEDLGRGQESADGFQLSSTEASGEPIRFGFEDDLDVFSSERLFAPTGGTVFDVLFFDPFDQTGPAAVSGLGIVFNNVASSLKDSSQSNTFVNFFTEEQDMATDTAAYSFAAEQSSGLSFLGVLFDEPIIAGATVYAGLIPFDEAKYGSDVVAMDDFIFGEPTVAPVPIPASALMLGSTLFFGGGAAMRRNRRRTHLNQGG